MPYRTESFADSVIDDRYAEDMNSDIGWRERIPRELESRWGQPQYPQGRYGTRTRTTPVVTRTRVERRASPERQRPVSSGGNEAIIPIRPATTPRASSYTQPTSLEEFRNTRRWPPRGYKSTAVLDPREAEDLIGSGASTFKGYWDEIPHVPGHYRFFAVMESAHLGRTDRATFQSEAFKDISLTMTGPEDSAFPWFSLEQPSMAYCFGRSPGTTTLNFRVSKSGTTHPPMQYASHARPRKIKLLVILERLRMLETGLEEDDPEELYHYLYGTLIEDPEKHTNRHYGLEMQIIDLITVLTNSEWIDFSLPKNQVVAKFFDSNDAVKKQQFFHQLLLAVELYLRIHSSEHTEKAKKKLLKQLPPKVAWDLALAQRWLENMSISKCRTSSNQSTFSFDLRSKKRQKDALRTFASVLKWPNLDELGYVLDEKDPREKAVEDRSADAMSWFTGVVLPGATLPWLLMNSVIDCDRDTGDGLKYLTHMYPASGFQYRANTYWSYQCIVGKVLGAARGVNQIGGWIGPCNYTPDLKRTECVRIRQCPPPEPRLTRADIDTMAIRTEPLGPQDDGYPVEDYDLLMPDIHDVTDAIRVEKLSFQPVREQPVSTRRMGEGAPLTFDAAIQFACGGESWPMRLRYDVDFVAAYPCHQGPHVLFYDYTYRAIKVDAGLVDIHDWGAQSRGRSPRSRPHSRSPSADDYPYPPSHRHSPSNPHPHPHSQAVATLRASSEVDDDAGEQHRAPANSHVNRVLAIEALGVSDNEVFARAWCAHHGLSAVVANIKETCMACAVREAYAACLSVVILTQGGMPDERDEVGVEGLL